MSLTTNEYNTALYKAIQERGIKINNIKTEGIDTLVLPAPDTTIDSAHSGIYKFKPFIRGTFILHVVGDCYSVVLPGIVAPSGIIYIHNRTPLDVLIINPTVPSVINEIQKPYSYYTLPANHSYRFNSSTLGNSNTPKWLELDIIQHERNNF